MLSLLSAIVKYHCITGKAQHICDHTRSFAVISLWRLATTFQIQIQIQNMIINVFPVNSSCVSEYRVQSVSGAVDQNRVQN